MSEEYEIEALAYRDPRQTFAQQVASCPAYMCIREAVQNGIEAATDREFTERYGADAGKIEFTATEGSDIDDDYSGQKIGILSYGRWMTFDELVSYTDIGAGLKTRGLARNFGIGMKLAGLAASPAGIIIRTFSPEYRPAGLDPNFCVGEVILAGRIDETGEFFHGRLRLSPESPDRPCLRVRSKEDFPGRDWSKPWTEVVFIGSDPAQETVDELFGPARGLFGNQFWTMSAVNCRYYSLPGELTVYRGNISQTNMAQKHARGLRVHIVDDWSANHSTVNAEHSVFGRCIITYGLLMDSKSCNSTLQSFGIPVENQGNGHTVLVYRSEIYDGRFGKAWGGMASKFGLPHGQKRLYVHVELVDDFVQPTQDRTRLRLMRTAGRPDCEIQLEDFAEIIRNPEIMPQWVKDYMEEVSAGAIRSESLQEELRRLIDRLSAQERVKNRSKPDESGTETEVADLPGKGNGENEPGEKKKTEPPKRKRRGVALPTQLPQPPRVEWVTIEGSDGKFKTDREGAHFDNEANILRMNLEYHGYLCHLQEVFAEEGADDETTQSMICEAMRNEYGFRIGSHIISAFHNRNARVIDPGTLNAVFDPANFICLMTTFDDIILMGFRQRYRRMGRQAQHG
jgi:hypothetical protein